MQARTFLSLLLACSGVCAAMAQRPERLAADAVWYGDADAGGEGGGDGSLREVGCNAGRPVWSEARDRVGIGGEVRVTSLATGRASPFPDVDAIETAVSVDFRRAATSNLSWSVMLSPGLASDFDDVTSDALRLKCLALATYQSVPAWRWVGGVYYGQAFGESRVFPAVGTVWRAAPEWTLNLIMPRPAVTYAPTRVWAVTALVQPAGGDWSIEHEGRKRELILETWRGGVEVSWRPNPGIGVDVQSGVAFARSLELRDGDDTVSEEDLDSVPYVRVGLRLF